MKDPHPELSVPPPKIRGLIAICYLTMAEKTDHVDKNQSKRPPIK